MERSAVKSVTVTMPAYCEARNIEGMVTDVIHTMAERLDDYEVIVVADGSLDETPDLVKSLARRYPRVRLVEHEINQGYGAAVFTGLLHATKEAVFLTDADRQFDLQEIDKFLSLIHDADLVIGYRSPRRDAAIRKFNGWGWSLLVTLLFGYVARDIDCAFKLIRRSVIDHLKKEMKSKGAAFSAEFLVRAKRAGFSVCEVPIHGHRPRTAGRPSGGRLDVILRAFRDLFLLRMALWREKGGRRAG